ncbi:MAG: energy-coupling factor transporter transmembrane component T family protein [Actinomycetota bacterium]
MTPLERLNPTVKLAVVTAVSVALLPVFDPWTPTALYVLALAGLLAARQVRPRALLVAQVPFALFGLGTFTVNALTRGGSAVAEAGPFEVTDDGLSVGAALAVRTLVVGVCVVGFVASTDPARLLTSLQLQARLPARVAFAVVAGYRVLDELPEQWTTILRAHAVRHPSARRRRDGAPRLTLALAARAALTLLVVALRRGERLAITMESRGLGAGPRTTWRPTPVRRADVAFVVGALACLAAVLAVSAWTGRLAGPGALTG